MDSLSSIHNRRRINTIHSASSPTRKSVSTPRPSQFECPSQCQSGPQTLPRVQVQETVQYICPTREGLVFSSHLHPVDLFKLAATTVLNMSDSRSDFDRSPSPIDPRYGHLRIPTNNSSEYCKRFIQKPQIPNPIDSIEQIY